MAGKRILVIEDDPANLRLMVLLLQISGHRVTGASTGLAGLDAAQRDRPDLILCDGYMPELDGFGVVRRVRADPALCTIPVVAVTGLVHTGQSDRLLAAGFNGCIDKPFDIKTFAGEVAQYFP
jgi:CheY-like chemotaxis protein